MKISDFKIPKKKKVNKRIFIVDDDKEYLEELKESLALNGYNVDLFFDKEAALKNIKEVKPDIIILDHKNANKTSIEIAKKLKNDLELSLIPIILITSYYDKSDYQDLKINFGITECLTKPVDPSEIDGAIKKFFKKRLSSRKKYYN